MNVRFSAVLIAVFLLAMPLFYLAPTAVAQTDNTFTFHLLNQADGTFSYRLNVVVPQELNDYYVALPHRSASDSDFPKFVTSQAVKPIADAMRQIYPDDEDFTNGVLTLVHQIPYAETIPQFYPVETLLRNRGDCDMFSLLAASILKAGGLNVVLLHYTSEEHMNIGVHLDQPPMDARLEVYSLESKNVTYYVAECTSSTWKDSWRVGECPDDLKNAPATVVALQNADQVSPGQVSASFKKLSPTSLRVSVSPEFTLEGGTVTMKGQVLPALAGQNVTIYVAANGSPWTTLYTSTKADGSFVYAWKADASGQVQVRTSWTGNDEYAGTTSATQNTLVLPLYFVALIAAAVGAIVVCIAVFAKTRRKRRKLQVEERVVSTPLDFEI